MMLAGMSRSDPGEHTAAPEALPFHQAAVATPSIGARRLDPLLQARAAGELKWAGSSTVNTVSASFDTTEMVPPCSSTMF